MKKYILFLLAACCISSQAYAQICPVGSACQALGSVINGTNIAGAPSATDRVPVVQGNNTNYWPYQFILNGPTVANTTALRAACTSYTSCPSGKDIFLNGVTRLTDGVAGAPPLFFAIDVNHICTSDDVGRCVKSANLTTSYWLAQYSEIPNAKEWGAIGNGSTNDTTAIQNCINASGKLGCRLAATLNGYFTNTGITVGNAQKLIGDYVTDNNGEVPSGSFLLCANLAFNCLTLTGTGPVISNIGIAGVSGTPVAGANGLFLNIPFYTNIYNVVISNRDSCISMFGETTFGLGATFINPKISKCATYYWYIDGFPAVNVIGGRTGGVGAIDYSGLDAYIYVTNSSCTGGGCGPNAIYFTNHIFNPGGIANANATRCLIDFTNFTGSAQNNQDWKIVQSHVEQIINDSTGGVVCGDNTINVLTSMDFIDDDFIVGGGVLTNFFNIGSNTAVNGINVIGGQGNININLTPSSRIWNNIVVSSLLTPINVTIAPTGTGDITQSNISNNRITNFIFTPASNARNNGITIDKNVITTSFNADWSGEPSTANSVLTLIGNDILSNASFNAGPVADGQMQLSANNFAKPVTMSGVWFALTGTGIMTGGLTDSSTGIKLYIDQKTGILASGSGAASKYVCVDANNKLIISATAC